jgi:RNA polymerase-binding transcription factor DksA
VSEHGEPTEQPVEMSDETIEAHVDPAGDASGGDLDVDLSVDLDAIEADLRNVEVALDRLADGTYWTDEVTGQPIPDEVLVLDPTARRA